MLVHIGTSQQSALQVLLARLCRLHLHYYYCYSQQKLPSPSIGFHRDLDPVLTYGILQDRIVLLRVFLCFLLLWKIHSS